MGRLLLIWRDYDGKTRFQQESNNAAHNNNPLPQTGNEAVTHFDTSFAWSAAEDNWREEVNLPVHHTNEQLKEVEPNPNMM